MSTPRFGRVLITGARGQLARALARAAPEAVQCIGFSREELDIRDESAVRAAVENTRPDLLINGAAYNLVDKAESDGAEDAIAINALGAAQLAKVCRERNIPLVHFSSDFVFDGKKSTPYEESDATQPLNIYGASKLAGENIVLSQGAKNWAIRVCRLFGPTLQSENSSRKPSGNFPLLMLRLAREKGIVRVVNDQVAGPTYTPDLAHAVWQLLEKSDGGLFHLCNAGEVAFDDYARAVFEITNTRCKVVSISSEEYGAAARRPKYSTLSNAKAEAHGVEAMRHWEDALREFLRNEVKA